jgi:hypothetical protein
MTHSARWIDQQTADLLQADTEIRLLLRELQQADPMTAETRTTAAARYQQKRLTISVREARTMLRAALPAPGPTFRGRARQRHAAMITAMSLFQSHLITMASGQRDAAWNAERRSLSTALDLVDALREWCAEMRWRQATTKEGLRWPRQEAGPVSISAVTQQQAPAERNKPRTAEQPQAEHQARTRRTA